MIRQHHERSVSDITRAIQNKASESAVQLVVMTELHQTVICGGTKSQFHASKSWKQHRQTLERLVVDVAESTTTSTSTNQH